MAVLNKVLLIGNLGSDPEIRTLPSGAKVANFSIATTESYTDRSGHKQDQTEWHRIELWEGLANVAEQYLKKGDSVYIEGRIRSEKWTDQNGQEKTGIRIRGTAMQMLGGGGARQASGGAQTGQPASNPSNSGNYPERSQKPEEQAFQAPIEEDDLPF
jgi:single-strand DNA-binding protein